MKHTLIIMAAPNGVGKSTLAKIIQESHEDCVIVSRNAIRFAKLRDGDDYFKYEEEVEREYYHQINVALGLHRYVIADATQITMESRQKLYSCVRKDANTEFVCVWIEVPIATALKQNAQRTGRAFVEESIIRQMYKHKVSPNAEKEPLDRIFFLQPEQGLASSTSSPVIKNFIDELRNL